MPSLDLLGLGSPIMDLTASVPDSFLATVRGEKGGMVLVDAAEMDGAGHWRALWLVVLPNLKPVLSALAIILFIDCWNEYFWPLLVTDAPESRTVQIGIREFLEADHNDFGGLMAGVTLASLPALAVFFLFQRKVMDTFVASGIKG